MSFHNDTFRGVCYWYTPYHHDQCGVGTTLVVASMSCTWVSGTHCPKKTYKLESVCRRDVFRNAEFYSLHGSGIVIQSAPFSKTTKKKGIRK